MKIAIPLHNGHLSPHFGHSEAFGIYSVEGGQITAQEVLPAPTHEHGSYPEFLRQMGCTAIIAGGMGDGARALLAANHIEVFCGKADVEPLELVRMHIRHELEPGSDACTHEGCDHEH